MSAFTAVSDDHIASADRRVTSSALTTPRWFAARGGWTSPQAPDLFAGGEEHVHFARRRAVGDFAGEFDELVPPPESSSQIAARVKRAREIQREHRGNSAHP